MNTTYNQFFITDVVLEDERVRLEPLEEKHFDQLLPIAMHPELWRYTTAQIKNDTDFRNYFNTALEEKAAHRSYPFAKYDKQRNQYAGSTRFGNIDFPNKKLEIGWTWIDPALHGTGFNKHCKHLLLQYAFEQLQLNRVELKTSHLNLKSQAAMLKIGATKEGTFRNHMINQDGSIRHSVYFSFIKEEWPEIKATIFKELS